jgi:transcriptional regulator with XRE-family HTH domain
MAKWVRKRFDPGTLESPDEKPFFYYGKAIRHFRKAARLTQEQLALSIEGHSADISRLESGDANPEFSTISRVADGLGISVSRIFSLGEGYAERRKKPDE